MESNQHGKCIKGQPADDVGKFVAALNANSSNSSNKREEVHVTDALPQILACVAAASFHIMCGAVLVFSAVLIPQLEAADSDIQVTKQDISWIASVVLLVVPLGALLAGYLLDKIGRVSTTIASVLPFIVGWVCIALARGMPLLIIGRFFSGIALAMCTAPGIAYITEIASPDLRGTLTSLGPLFTPLGMIVMYYSGSLLHWRMVAWLTILYCLPPTLLMALWSPESPSWLVAQGRTQDALKSLSILSRRDKKAGIADRQLLHLINEEAKKKESQQGSSLITFMKCIIKPTGYKPLIILTIIFFFQMFSGIYITLFYAVSIFQDIGTTVDPHLSSVGIGVVRLIMGLLTAFLMKRFGRRPLFTISGVGMAVCMLLSGYIIKLVNEGDMKSNVFPAVCILLYMSLGVLGLLTIPWTMSAELFPLHIRGMAQGVVTALANIFAFASIKVYPFLPEMMGGTHAVHWLFAAVSLVAVLFILIFLPETHKKQLTDIQEYFKHSTIYIMNKDKSSGSWEQDGEEMDRIRQIIA